MTRPELLVLALPSGTCRSVRSRCWPRRDALTDVTVDDATTGVELIAAVSDDIARVTADAAYDTVAFYDAARARGATVVVPPAKTAGCPDAGRGRALVIRRSPR